MTTVRSIDVPLGLDKYEPEKYWYGEYPDGGLNCIRGLWGPHQSAIAVYTDQGNRGPNIPVHGAWSWRQGTLDHIANIARASIEKHFVSNVIIGISIDESPQVIPL